jgi:hypothetical protein
LFDYDMPLVLRNGTQTGEEYLISRAREGALSLQFRQGSKTIVRELGENNRALVDLISVVRAIESSADSRVTRVVITGFTSPEGLLVDNQKLAQARADAVRAFVLDNSTLGSSRVQAHNGAVDWEGLRKLVADSNMPGKFRVLQIIDETPIWDARRNVGRHGELMRLNGGETYKYMLQYFFPQMRQAAFIKVYYDIK